MPEWEDLKPIPLQELEEDFPRVSGRLDKDAYFSINGLDKPKRNGDNVGWFTSCFVDLDIYKGSADDLTVEEAIERVNDARDRGDIPAPSLLVKSGRGVWAFWFLRNPEKPGEPERATDENQTLFKLLEVALIDRFHGLGIDTGSKDTARTTRIPGSINSEGGRRVRYFLQATGEGEEIVYSLQALADFFKIDATDLPDVSRPSKGAKTSKKRISTTGLSPQRKTAPTWGGLSGDHQRRSNAKARWPKALDQFEKLRQVRKGFRGGHRHHAVLLYTTILNRNGVPHSEIHEKAAQLASECLNADGTQPDPYSPEECTKTVKSCLNANVGKLANQTISDHLKITPDEAKQIGGTWGPASQYLTEEERRLAREEKEREKNARLGPSQGEWRAYKEGRIRDRIEELSGEVPTVREMSEYLKREHNLSMSPKTVLNYYRAMGIKNPRARSA